MDTEDKGLKRMTGTVDSLEAPMLRAQILEALSVCKRPKSLNPSYRTRIAWTETLADDHTLSGLLQARSPSQFTPPRADVWAGEEGNVVGFSKLCESPAGLCLAVTQSHSPLPVSPSPSPAASHGHELRLELAFGEERRLLDKQGRPLITTIIPQYGEESDGYLQGT